MQSSTTRHDTSYISLGERRGKSDLAQFSLDTNWARARSDSARLRAYPSPPMSGSPPLPPRRNPDSGDRAHGGYVSSGQDVFRGHQGPQLEQAEHRGQAFRTYLPEQMPLPSFTPFRMEDMPTGQMSYQQPRPQMTPQMTPQQHHQQLGYGQPQQMQPPFTTPERTPIGAPSEFSSPKVTRKTKGHVASACVPCKKAHLRCDAQRPCSRCLSNGKEDSCIDVQHKKRGRPRLRDEREPRYDTMSSGYPQVPMEAGMRRPVSMYTPGSASMGGSLQDPLHRSGSYRVLKSQGPAPLAGHTAPRYIPHSTLQDVNIYGPPMQPAPRMVPLQEPICAYLNMEMQLTKATQSFGDSIGSQSLLTRKFQEIVIPGDVEKVNRLQRVLEEERRKREPNYLPPIYLRQEEDRVIQGVGFGPDEMGQFRPDTEEFLTFIGSDGQQRTFHARMGLTKKDSTYFIAVLLNLQPQTQAYAQPQASYQREIYPREPQYEYQPPQPGYVQNPGQSMYAQNPNFEQGMGMRPQGALGSNIPTSAPNMSTFTQLPQRQEYVQPSQPVYQTPRSELQQQGQSAQRQRDLQLPPIRDQRGEVTSTDSRRRDDRSGRVDIGGLIDKPELGRKGV